MLFNSLQFLIFFPIVVGVLFRLRPAARLYWLLAASCYFYMAFVPSYILILFFLILTDYTAGLLIERSSGVPRRAYVIASLTANIATLGFFKYFNFFDHNAAVLAHGLGLRYSAWALKIVLPIGLSFHTFQSMSYVLEVNRGAQRAERHLGVYALYVLFFPQMVAGPIERPQNLLPQLRRVHKFDHERVTSGLVTMALGFFKKLVIADRFAIVVNAVYGSPGAHPTADLILATYCFAFQIYCDFSGYSDIAIGAARVMGYDLMNNFDRPYSAHSVSEFWKRWHISLSTWFRDYLYVPLGGQRVARRRWYANLFVVFIISGLWHGANWTFVCWGALHGAFLVGSLWTARLRARARTALGLDAAPRLRGALQVAITFHLVLLGWVFFRASSVSAAANILTRIATSRPGSLSPDLGLPLFDIAIGFAAVAMLEFGHHLGPSRALPGWVRAQPMWLRWPVYYALLFAVAMFGKFSAREFIYFQF